MTLYTLTNKNMAQGQIKNKFDKVTVKKIVTEGLTLAGLTLAVYVLQALLTFDFGQFTLLIVPALRWLIGDLQQLKKEEVVVVTETT